MGFECGARLHSKATRRLLFRHTRGEESGGDGKGSGVGWVGAYVQSSPVRYCTMGAVVRQARLSSGHLRKRSKRACSFLALPCPYQPALPSMPEHLTCIHQHNFCPPPFSTDAKRNRLVLTSSPPQRVLFRPEPVSRQAARLQRACMHACCRPLAQHTGYGQGDIEHENGFYLLITALPITCCPDRLFLSTDRQHLCLEKPHPWQDPQDSDSTRGSTAGQADLIPLCHGSRSPQQICGVYVRLLYI